MNQSRIFCLQCACFLWNGGGFTSTSWTIQLWMESIHNFGVAWLEEISIHYISYIYTVIIHIYIYSHKLQTYNFSKLLRIFHKNSKKSSVIHSISTWGFFAGLVIAGSLVALPWYPWRKGLWGAGEQDYASLWVVFLKRRWNLRFFRKH